MSITIKNRYGQTLYVSGHARSVREAAEEAVTAGVDPGGASLAFVCLADAALLGDESDPSHELYDVRLDLWAVLDQAPAEVAALQDALSQGRVDGRQVRTHGKFAVGYRAEFGDASYHDAGEWAIATIAEPGNIGLDERGTPLYYRRLAERWFAPIRPRNPELRAQWGWDCPSNLPADDPEGPFRAAKATEWINAWRRRKTLDKALCA